MDNSTLNIIVSITSIILVIIAIKIMIADKKLAKKLEIAERRKEDQDLVQFLLAKTMQHVNTLHKMVSEEKETKNSEYLRLADAIKENLNTICVYKSNPERFEEKIERNIKNINNKIKTHKNHEFSTSETEENVIDCKCMIIMFKNDREKLRFYEHIQTQIDEWKKNKMFINFKDISTVYAFHE